ncbi:MAG: hypothetical protein R2706_18110 [Acidimicrobiales bacterium]
MLARLVPGLSGEAVRCLARQPHLWPTAARAAASLAPRHWWRHAPFLPLPDRTWMKFRVETAYGGDGSTPMRGDDLITWLEWKKTFPR